MSGGENIATETDENPELYQGYPLLNPNYTTPPARPSAPSESVNTQPAVVVSQPIPVASKVVPKLPLWKRLKPSSSWFLKAKSREPVDTDKLMWAEDSDDDANDVEVATPSISPDYRATKLVSMLENHKPIAEILREGGAEKLKEEGISLDDLYKYGYALRDIHIIFPEFQSLLDFGFTKHHLFGTWYLDQLCTLYDKEKTDICLTLKFKAPDFIRTNTPPEEMAAMGIDATILRSNLGSDFETLFAMNIRFEEFAGTFQLTRESLRALGLTKFQKYALASHRGWTPQAVARHCKIGFEELNDIWFAPGMD